MTTRKKPVIYVNGKPYTKKDDEIEHPEHILVEESVDIMQGFMDVMARPVVNLNRMLKYFLKAVTFSE